MNRQGFRLGNAPWGAELLPLLGVVGFVLLLPLLQESVGR
jgi:hypothetical protein